jgi:hypothetical protein
MENGAFEGGLINRILFIMIEAIWGGASIFIVHEGRTI